MFTPDFLEEAFAILYRFKLSAILGTLDINLIHFSLPQVGCTI
jgi:hypothetical protein